MSHPKETDPKLVFVENLASEVEGLGHAGIETFRDTPFTSCAREAGQNSLDAADGRPVRLVFRCHTIRSADIPGVGTLRETIRRCLAEARRSGNEKENDFFENASRVVSEGHLRVLEIADYNTTGLEGPPDTPGSKFHALVKSSGKSAKDSDTSGGSFGIGKNASFAVSDLRTVFYSTVYSTGATEQSAVQGKIQLVSHQDGNGGERRATGYWGHPEKFRAVQDPALVPTWLKRSEKGTSVFTVGFRAEENWIDRMTVPLLSNYLCAVDEGDVEFVVGEKDRVIDKQSLPDLLRDERLSGSADATALTEDFEFAGHLFECRNSTDSVQREFRIDGIGTFSARILVREGMPKRVAIVRNGMLITRSLEFFGDKLARFAGARDFVMLIEPANDGAGRTLKALENPRHNAFSAERLDDPDKQRRVKTGMKHLISEIRTLVKDEAEVTSSDAVRLDDLGEFFADTGSEESVIASDEKDPETIVFTPVARARPKKPRPVAPETTGQEGGAGHDDGTGGARTDGAGFGEGRGTGGRGDRGHRPLAELSGFRNVRTSQTTRKIFFTPRDAGEIELSLFANGIYDSAGLKVINVSGPGDCSLDDGKITLNSDAESRVVIEVTFAEIYAGPLEVVAVRGIRNENRPQHTFPAPGTL